MASSIAVTNQLINDYRRLSKRPDPNSSSRVPADETDDSRERLRVRRNRARVYLDRVGEVGPKWQRHIMRLVDKHDGDLLLVDQLVRRRVTRERQRRRRHTHAQENVSDYHFTTDFHNVSLHEHDKYKNDPQAAAPEEADLAFLHASGKRENEIASGVNSTRSPSAERLASMAAFSEQLNRARALAASGDGHLQHEDEDSDFGPFQEVLDMTVPVNLGSGAIPCQSIPHKAFTSVGGNIDISAWIASTTGPQQAAEPGQLEVTATPYLSMPFFP